MLERTLDIIVGAIGMLVFAVTFPLVALAIKVDSPKGPVIFAQKRIGLKGKKFTFYKYRSMSHDGHVPYETPKLDHEHFRTFVFVTPSSRLTRVGRLLRAMSLDELPNFWNVLRGDMRLVGPRPEIPELVEQYPPEYHARHDVKPGITGLAQISGRADLTYEETMQYDLDYVANRAVARDVSIILRTVPAVLTRKGAR
jgi:lipopolysaccharide/colanic/teichoic acid biosynthesis glycosyltransferase